MTDNPVDGESLIWYNTPEKHRGKTPVTYLSPKGVSLMASSRCEYCAYYSYDDYEDWYTCEMNLDEDDMVRFLSGNTNECPYFRDGDEYAVVRKQN